MIFVFGSNLAGRHGKGAALAALKDHGAIWGCPEGIQGNSYAIPTKDENLKTLPLEEIKKYVDNFLEYAGFMLPRSELEFQVTPIGCGLAGYRYNQIAPMFKGAPQNVILPEEFKSEFTGRI